MKQFKPLCPLCHREFETFGRTAAHLIIEHKRTPEEADALFMDAKHNGIGIAIDLGVDSISKVWIKDMDS